MKHFQTFTNIFQISSTINDLMIREYKDEISFFHPHKNGFFKASLNRLSNSKISLSLKNSLSFFNTKTIIEASTQRTFFGFFDQSFFGNKFHIKCFGLSPQYIVNSQQKRYFSKGKYGASISYNNQTIKDYFLGFSLQKDSSLATLLSISALRYNLCLKVVSSDHNFISISFYDENSLMLYIKCNSSIPRVLNAEIGYLKEWNNSRSATYVLISPFKGTIAFGGLSLYSQKLSFAFVGNANIKKKKIDLEAGVKISTETDLRAKINQNGDIELFSKFKPRDWLTVTLRSEAPLNVSSWPVSFGWSLQFCK